MGPDRFAATRGLVLCTFLAALAEAGALPKDTAARVNGALISRRSLADVVAALEAAADDPPGPETLPKLRRQALDSLVDFELLYQDAQARGVEVAREEIADNIKKTEGSFGSPTAYREALSAKGLTPSDIERDTRKTLLVRRLLEEVVWRDLDIGEDAIRAFYEQNRAQFNHPDEVRASHILVRHNTAGRSPDEARRKAEGLARQAGAGESFAALARRESEDPATAPRGGDLGYFSRGTMVESFENAAFSLAPGGVSGVIETPFGLHVIMVTGKRPAGVAPLDEVRERIAAVLGNERRQQLQDAFVAALRRKATIEIAPDLE